MNELVAMVILDRIRGDLDDEGFSDTLEMLFD